MQARWQTEIIKIAVLREKEAVLKRQEPGNWEITIRRYAHWTYSGCAGDCPAEDIVAAYTGVFDYKTARSIALQFLQSGVADPRLKRAC